MDKIPQIRPIFLLTKNDSSDFDREALTQKIGIVPSKSSAPTISKGKLYPITDLSDGVNELSGFTILPADSPPYQMVKHAFWSVEMPKIDCWSLDEPLCQLEAIFKGKESIVRQSCKESDLCADLIFRVFAESNRLPDLTIPRKSLVFWAAMGVSIGFDFYLD